LFKLRLVSAAYRIQAFAVVLLAVCLAGCPSQPRRPATPAGAAVPEQPAPRAPAEGRRFEIDSGASLLTIQVYRGGALARAGHNHVVASHDLAGTAHVPENLSGVSFDIHLPVNLLTVDEEELRKQAGPDFPPGVPEEAKAGTKRNMLGEAMLDGDRYPEILLQSEAVRRAAEGNGVEAQVRAIVRDQAFAVIVPLQYRLDGDTLEVNGEMPLKQTDVGITPFSLFGGALKVEDGLKIRFHLVARANATP
jgi:hypothetical protein